MVLVNDDGWEEVEDLELATKIIQRNCKKEGVSKSTEKAIISLKEKGLLHIFLDGSISLTEKAKPVAEALSAKYK